LLVGTKVGISRLNCQHDGFSPSHSGHEQSPMQKLNAEIFLMLKIFHASSTSKRENKLKKETD